MNDDYQVFTHGICLDEGDMLYAYQVFEADSGDCVKEEKFCDPAKEGNTVHLAEYLAVTNALEWLYRQGYHRDQFIRFFCCSELVSKQMNGQLNVGEGSYKKEAVRALIAADEHFWSLTFERVPEDENTAIALVKEMILEKT